MDVFLSVFAFKNMNTHMSTSAAAASSMVSISMLLCPYFCVCIYFTCLYVYLFLYTCLFFYINYIHPPTLNEIKTDLYLYMIW